MTDWYGVAITTTARTLVDLGRHDRWDAIMAVDAALRESRVEPGDLEDALARARGWPGVRRARDVLALGDARSESPLESITRLRLHDDGFPIPVLQQPFVDAARGRTYYVDLWLPEHGLAIEADGAGKYRRRPGSDEDPLVLEKRRETRLRALGVGQVERVMWADVTTGWAETSDRLRANLR